MGYYLQFDNSNFNQMLVDHLEEDIIIDTNSFEEQDTDLEKLNFLCSELTQSTNELRFEIGIDNVEQMCRALKHGEFKLKGFDTETGDYTEIAYTPPKGGVSDVFPPTQVASTDNSLISLLEKRASISKEMEELNAQIKEQMEEGLHIFEAAKTSLAELHEEWTIAVEGLLDQSVALEAIDLEAFGSYVKLIKEFRDKLLTLYS